MQLYVRFLTKCDMYIIHTYVYCFLSCSNRAGYFSQVFLILVVLCRFNQFADFFAILTVRSDIFICF